MKDMTAPPPVTETQVIRVVKAMRRDRRAQWGPVVLGTAGVLAFLLVWQLYSQFGPISDEFLPYPAQVLSQFFANFAYASFWASVGATLWAWMLGLAISSIAGLVVGVLIGSSRFLRKATFTVLEFLRPIPSVALIPIAALAFGPQLGAELLVIVYGCFFVVLIQTLYGVADVDKVAYETTLTMGMTWLQRARYLVLPTLLPYFITGVRLSATIALILGISAELIIGTDGLGQSVAQAQLNGAPVAMYALIITAGVLGIVINLGARAAERKVLFWHESIRAEVPA